MDNPLNPLPESADSAHLIMDITPQIHTYLTTAPGSHFLNQEVTMLAQWEGADNLLWRFTAGGQEAVLKLFLDAGQARSRRQHEAQQVFAPLGLAPRPLWADRYPHGLSRQVLIYEWLPGVALDPANAQQMVALANSVARVHGTDPGAVQRLSPNPINLDYVWRILRGSIAPIQTWLGERQANALATIFEQLTEHTEALVEAALPLWAQATPTPVHGDLRLDNAIDSFGANVLLDWELFGLGDPALEVANFLYRQQHLLEATTQAEWLEQYLATFDQPGLLQRIGVYQRVLPFQATCFLLDGLRQHGANPEDAQALTENLPFLTATLHATLLQAADALNLELTNVEEAVQTLLSLR